MLTNILHDIMTVVLIIAIVVATVVLIKEFLCTYLGFSKDEGVAYDMYVYPAVFTCSESGITFKFPNFAENIACSSNTKNVCASGRKYYAPTKEDAFLLAEEALSSILSTMYIRNETPPKPCDILTAAENFGMNNYQYVSYVSAAAPKFK